MRIEASKLRIADVVRMPGQREEEIVRCQEVAPDVRVWFRGNEESDEPSMVVDAATAVEVARRGECRPAGIAVQAEPAPRVQVEARGPGRPADRERQADNLRELAGRLIADAMMSAADQVERGELTYVARLISRPQVADLEAALGDARRGRERQSGERIEGCPELADIPFARFTGVAICKRDLRELMVHAGDRVEAGRRERMQLLAEGEDRQLELIGKDIELIRALLVRDGKEKLAARIVWIADQTKRLDRLGRLGIRDTASLRAALREYLGCYRGLQRRQAAPNTASTRERIEQLGEQIEQPPPGSFAASDTDTRPQPVLAVDRECTHAPATPVPRPAVVHEPGRAPNVQAATGRSTAGRPAFAGRSARRGGVNRLRRARAPCSRMVGRVGEVVR
jgi:hypothetical protein